MKQTKELVYDKLIEKVSLFALFLLISVLLPAFLHQQIITGPIVNAVLILCTLYLGTTEGLLLGLLPSTVALSSGLLPLPMAAVVPFIMISNAVLVLSFSLVRRSNILVKVILPALLKFGFLSASAYLVLGNLLSSELGAKVLNMFGYMQFITALTGIGLALFVFKFLNKESEADR